MNKMQNFKIASVAALLGAWACSAQAGLDGSTVDVAAYYPSSSSIYQDGGVTTVGATVEYPYGTFPSYNGDISVDVTDTQMIISNPQGTSFLSAAFNGFILTVLSGPTITSATVDGSSAFDPTALTVVGGDEILVNFEGVTESGGDSVIDFTTAAASTPDGGLTVAMLGSVMAGLGLIRRKL